MSLAYLEGIDRHQQFLLPECVEDYVGPENPVRAIDAFVEGMSAGEAHSALPPLREMSAEGGCKGYHPATMARLFIWGYINRVRSTRRLETDAGRNLELIWLLGKLQPDHSSISRFRKANAKRIKQWLKEFNLICASLDLFGGEEIAIDGVFLKGVNSKRNNHTQSQLNRRIESLNKRIDGFLADLEASEKEEDARLQARQLETLKEKLAGLEKARARAQQLLEQAQASPTGQVSTVDPVCRLLNKNSAPGASIVGVLAESVVDSKKHLIAAAEVVDASNDFGQLSLMAAAADEVLPELPRSGSEDKSEVAPRAEAEIGQPARRRVLGDGGYFEINDLARCEELGWDPYVPPYPERKTNAGKYPVADFVYDEDQDAYVCPGGESLQRHSDYRKNEAVYQTYYNTAACRECPLKEQCTGAEYRKIHRHENQAVVGRMRERLEADPPIYKRRAATVEHPFGSMMFWNEGKNLLCRGLELANAEFSLSALAYNFKRALKVVGVGALVEAMRQKAASRSLGTARNGRIAATRGSSAPIVALMKMSAAKMGDLVLRFGAKRTFTALKCVA